MFGFQDATKLGTELWPRQGMVPPVIRIQFEEPPRYRATYGPVVISEGGGLRVELQLNEYIDTLSDKEKQDFTEQVKRAALERVLPKFNQWATGLRDNIDRTGISAIMHKQWVDDAVIMDYYSHHNSSRLDLTIKYDAWISMAAKIGGESDMLCMFIFHSGNRITAVPMDDFKEGRFKAVADYEQLQDSWGSQRVKATQMRFSADFSVLLTTLTRQRVNNADVFKSKESYHVTSVASRDIKESMWWYSGKDYKDALVPKAELPVLNGQGDNFYTLKSTGSVSKYDLSVSVKEVGTDVAPGKPFGVTATGTLLSGLCVYTPYMHVRFLFTPYDADGTEVEDALDIKGGVRSRSESDYAFVSASAADEINAMWDELSQTQLPTPSGGNVYPSMMSLGTLCRDGIVTYDYTYGIEDNIPKPNMSCEGVKPVHTFSGGFDRLEYQVVMADVTVDWSEGAAYFDSFDWTYGIYHTHLDSRAKEEATFEQIMWPPSTAGDDTMWMKTDDKIFETPYGKFNKLEPWLHVSNGEYCIQAVVGDGSPIVWHKGASFESELRALTEVSLEEIQCIYLDMPLSLLFPEKGL